MTFPNGSGVFTNNSGPGTLSTGTQVAGGSSGISVVTTPPGAAANVPDTTPTQAPTWQFANSKMAVQVDLDTIEGPAQGTLTIVNVSSVTLAGYPATGFGSCSFVQTSGAWQSK